MAGNYYGTIFASFWDIETTGQSTSAGGTGKTTTQMKTKSTFTSTGWDFTTPVWIIDEGNDYPRLWWQNHAPVANAGQDQTVYAWIDGFADVTLNGSASSDEDGDELTYHWSWVINGNTYNADGVNPTIELPAGEHTITLIVNDGWKDSEPNDVVITVVPSVEATLWMLPRVLNRQSQGRCVIANLRLQEGILPQDIDRNERLLLYPGGITASRQLVASEQGDNTITAIVLGFFDRDEFAAAVGRGTVAQVTVVGRLTSGRYFYGSDRVRLIDRSSERSAGLRDH
jgi:hypothetical protein